MLIDSENLIARIDKCYQESAKIGLGMEPVMAIWDIKALISVMPTVDAEPLKHGNWEEPQPESNLLYGNRLYAQCCLCKKKSYLGWKDNYCRYCGAKMDLEEQHDD